MPYIKQEEYDRLVSEAADAATEMTLELYTLRGELKAQEILIDKLLNKLIVSGMVRKTKD